MRLVRFEPAKPCQCFSRRDVFAPDPAFVRELVQKREQVGIIDFTNIWLMPTGYSGNLYMAGNGQVAMNVIRELATHHLGVVNVELQAHIGLADLVDNSSSIVHVVKEITRYIHGVDRFD